MLLRENEVDGINRLNTPARPSTYDPFRTTDAFVNTGCRWGRESGIDFPERGEYAQSEAKLSEHYLPAVLKTGLEMTIRSRKMNPWHPTPAKREEAAEQREGDEREMREYDEVSHGSLGHRECGHATGRLASERMTCSPHNGSLRLENLRVGYQMWTPVHRTERPGTGRDEGAWLLRKGSMRSRGVRPCTAAIARSERCDYSE